MTKAKYPAVRRAELLAAIVTTAVAIFLLVIRAQHAGALWRDESASAQLARYPAQGILKEFPHEAFPPPYFFGLRSFISLFGDSDLAFRNLGIVVGTLLLLVIWINARLLQTGLPLIALSFLALNPTFLEWGTSLRAYGLGSSLILFAFGAAACLVFQFSWPRAILAAAAAIASVQLLLYNSVLIAAILIGLMTVAFGRRNFRLVAVAIGIAVLCGLSMLPYLPAYLKATEWNMLQKGPLTIALIWQQLALALGGKVTALSWVWPLLVLCALAGAVILLVARRNNSSARTRDLLLFAVVAVITSVVGYYVFLKALSYGTRPWYYLALLAILAGALDLILAELSTIAWIRRSRLVVACVALPAFAFAAWPCVIERTTNVDLIAHKLERVAAPNDLIIVNPWWLGISFHRYYHGTAHWETLPTMDDHQIHRFDLVKAKMTSTNPIEDVEDMVAHTLQSGGRVWFVGGIQVPDPNEPVPRLPDVTDTDSFWNSDVYLEVWSAQLATFVWAHLLRVANVTVEPANVQVDPLEDAPLVGVEGWKD